MDQSPFICRYNLFTSRSIGSTSYQSTENRFRSAKFWNSEILELPLKFRSIIFILFLKWSEEKLLGCYVNFCWFEQVWKPCFKHFVSRLTNSSQTNFHFKSPLKSSFRFIHLKHFDAELGGCRKLTIKFTIFQVSWSSYFYQGHKLVTTKIASPWLHWDRSHFIKKQFS